jgi:hypothetical protein
VGRPEVEGSAAALSVAPGSWVYAVDEILVAAYFRGIAAQ